MKWLELLITSKKPPESRNPYQQMYERWIVNFKSLPDSFNAYTKQNIPEFLLFSSMLQNWDQLL